METNNQPVLNKQNDVERSMREFENAIQQGNFYDAVANFINLISSGSQFDIKIDEVDLNQLDQIDEENENQKKFYSNSDIYQNVKGINYEQIYNQKKQNSMAINQNYQNQIPQQMNNNYQNNVNNNQNRNGSNQNIGYQANQNNIQIQQNMPNVQGYENFNQFNTQNSGNQNFNFGDQIIDKSKFTPHEQALLLQKFQMNEYQLQNTSLDDLFAQYIIQTQQNPI
ncbi:hypothetical protein TTHERM_00411720 (macronuclear) [Tetrahymena thermophila SB210]|uniref:Uncharacterized protein n=1 Tax=Tetrahymena thermophila (strain SB210) TaxID=312017 RepID=I7M2K3_TETTS|nr:hypothetical protein TTHERM_00411720 [Tetrahymena thermophila SB210]EAS00621.3 hypothetical protein TTHERM_00411720 [Tetrahymena thermophila SB210]|eukprot:XP_001020866.3 hypothetical protein TTHERM_00411720 [Tetrahymena thermophila SB210]